MVEGTAEEDRLDGYVGDDALYGLAGDDRVNGRAGDDRIAGGAGNDTLIGGRGADTFAFGADKWAEAGGGRGGSAHERDLIIDYNKAEGDRLELADRRESVAQADVSDGNLRLTLDSGQVIRLTGIGDVADVAISEVDNANAAKDGHSRDWMLA